jgi:hypothetical protein
VADEPGRRGQAAARPGHLGQPQPRSRPLTDTQRPLTDGVRLPGMAAGDVPVPGTRPAVIGVRGARHNNLRDVDVDVPLWRAVAVAGVSGPGKTSLAMGTLHAGDMARFVESLSTYGRRRLTQAQRPDVDRIGHLPPALALRQRPPVPGPRSTVGTMSEVLNVLRLMMSRLGSHLCPNGHRVAPSAATPGHGGRLPGARRAFRASQRRVLRLQLLRRVPGLPRPGRAVRGRREHPGSRPGQDDRAGRGAAVEFPTGLLAELDGRRPPLLEVGLS